MKKSTYQTPMMEICTVQSESIITASVLDGNLIYNYEEYNFFE